MTIHIDLDWKQHPSRRRGLYTSHLQADGFYKLEVLDAKFNFGSCYPFVKDGRTRSPYYDAECARSDVRRVAIELDKDYAGASSKFFDQNVLKRLLHETAREPLIRGTFSYDPETLEPVFAMRKDGELKLWVTLDPETKAPSRNRAYCLGGDPGGGRGVNPSSIVILDKVTGEQVAGWDSPHIKPEQFGELMIAMARWFRGSDSYGCWLNWETNGTGGAVTDAVKRRMYSHCYRRKVKDKFGEKSLNTIGWFSSGGNKYELLGAVRGGGLRGALDSGRCIIHDEELLKEANNFIDNKGKVYHSRSKNSDDVGWQGDSHGDKVIAAAVAYLGVPYKEKSPDEPVEKKKQPEVNSPDWKIARAEAQQRGEVEEAYCW